VVSVSGKILSVPRLTEIADAEAEAARAFLSRINDSAQKSSTPTWAQEVMYSRAVDILQVPISVGSAAFNRAMFGSASGLIYLGWLSLRIKQPETKLADASALFSANPESLLEIEKVWGSGKNLLGPENQ
jgi:hypothetical protein